jgi:hypothetical protein
MGGHAAVDLAVTCLISTTVFWLELSSSGDWNGGKVVLYNAVFLATSIGALVCLVAGLRAPAHPRTRAPAHPRTRAPRAPRAPRAARTPRTPSA